MAIETIFFDLDDTLYDAGNGVWDAMAGRIQLYMKERVGLAEKEIPQLRLDYTQRYGTTLRGLHIHHEVDASEYLEFVHDIPIEAMISANQRLEGMLKRLKQHKWVFTNASKAHAERVLKALGVTDYFHGIVDIEAMEFQNKPQPAAYTTALDRAGKAEGRHCLFIDDRAKNLAPAKALGATTVLVGSREPHPAADHSIGKVEELLAAMPSLESSDV